MKLELVEEKVNRLLKRKELKYTVETEGSTPSRAELQRLIAAKNGVKEESVVIGYIRQRFGQPVSNVFVKVYESARAIAEIESKHLVERTEKSKKKEKEAKEKPKKEEEKPKEPVKEKPKKEDKPEVEKKEGEA